MSDAMVDAAIVEIIWVKKALGRYALLSAKIDRLRREEAFFSVHSVENMVERCALEKELEMLRPVALNHKASIAKATERLYRINGVVIKSVITQAIGAMVLLRLGQGYSNAQVAMMMGCSSSVVSRIKMGRYQYSTLPDNVKIGSRGRNPV